MANKSVWKRLLGVERIVIEDWDLEDGDRTLVVSALPAKGACGRCARCEERCPYYDQGAGRRRWRGMEVWMHVGRDAKTVGLFFEKLGPERCKALDIVTADGAAWIEEAVREHAPQAVRCLDPFHVVQWATKALDEVRREVWNDLRGAAQPEVARTLKNARWALWKNPEDLTPAQKETLGWIPKLNRSLYRAYLLKEALRGVFQAPTVPKALSRLDAWIRWAQRSRLKPFLKLARSLAVYRPRIEATLRTGMNNAIVEARNMQIRLFTRMAHGFKRVEALIGLAMLKLGRLCPPLPGRLQPTTPS